MPYSDVSISSRYFHQKKLVFSSSDRNVKIRYKYLVVIDEFLTALVHMF